MTIKAVLLDENMIYQRVDELEDESLLTPLHLPQITSCDLPPGTYRWLPEAGHFESVAWRASVDETRRKAMEDALNRGRRLKGARNSQ